MILHSTEERPINGGLDQYLILGLGEGKHGQIDGGNDARSGDHPVFFHLPAIASGGPSLHRFKEGIRPEIVAKDAMFQALLQHFLDAGRSGEVHIGHPKGNQIVTAIKLRERIMLEAARILAVYYFIKVKLHFQSPVFQRLIL